MGGIEWESGGIEIKGDIGERGGDWEFGGEGAALRAVSRLESRLGRRNRLRYMVVARAAGRDCVTVPPVARSRMAMPPMAFPPVTVIWGWTSSRGDVAAVSS